MNRNETIEKARQRMLERLKEIGLMEPRPGDYARRDDAFALGKFITEYHAFFLEIVLGREGKQEFFRMNVGLGPADVAYEELPPLGDEEGKGIRMPFFGVILAKRLARMQQRFYNIFVGPPSWNHAGSDTFYYSTEQELLEQIDKAATLAARVLPGFIEDLKHNNMAIPRPKSPYKFPRR